MADAVAPVDAGGHPLYIPADDGGVWNLVTTDPGFSCPISAGASYQPPINYPAVITPTPSGVLLII